MIQDSRFKSREKSRLFHESCFMHLYSSRSERGFTLVEMLVAFAIFSIIMVIAAGGLISLIEANRKTQATKTIVNNLHFALENMSRNIRMGTNYHCGGGTITLPADCPTSPASQIVFKARDGSYMAYRMRMDNGAITRSKNKDPIYLLRDDSFIPITAPEITLEKLDFYIDGADKNDNSQPKVLILSKGYIQGRSKVVSKFHIETLVSQRQLDI